MGACFERKKFLIFCSLLSLLLCKNLRGQSSENSIKVFSRSKPDFGYSGRIKVLEFWATWCAPCLAAFPHFNALASDTTLSEFTFISLTREDNHKQILSTLKRFPLKTVVGIDSGGLFHSTYKIDQLPTTVILDETGKVLYKGHYSVVNNFFLLNLRSKAMRSAEVSQNNINVTTVPERLDNKPGSDGILIEEASPDDGPGSLSFSATGYEVKNWPLNNLFGLQLLKKFSDQRIYSPFNELKVNIDFRFPEKLSTKNDTLVKHLKEKFKFSYFIRCEKSKVYELVVKDEAKFAELVATASGSKRASWVRTDEEFIFVNQKAAAVCQGLELNSPFIFLPGDITALLNLRIKKFKTIREMNRQLQRDYGLSFLRKRRPIDKLVLIKDH